MKRWAWAVSASVLLLAGCSGSPLPAETVTVPGPTVTVVAPAPTVTVTVEAAPESGGDLTDAQRHTLDTMSARGTEASLLDTYCPMDDGGRAYYADLIARQIDGMTPANVLQYFDEVC